MVAEGLRNDQAQREWRQEQDRAMLAAMRAEMPYVDPTHRGTCVGAENVSVEYEPVYDATDGSLAIRKTVWSQARRWKDRHILWQEVVAVIAHREIPAFVRDIVSSSMCEHHDVSPKED